MGSVACERDAYLRGQVEPDETVLATGSSGLVTDRGSLAVGSGELVTGRRILLAWRLNWPPCVGEWTHDAIDFEEITAWAEGRQHDERPILRITHPSHVRLMWAPAHRFLRFRWGNRTTPTSHEETELRFSGNRDPVFAAIRGHLGQTSAVRAAPLREQLPGTREDRHGSGERVLRLHGRGSGSLRQLGWRLRSVDHQIHHGHIHWWVRLGSWALLAVPAWLVSPWLVIPVIVLVKAAWVIGLQWSWRRTIRSWPAATK